MNHERKYKTTSNKDLRIYLIFWILYVLFFTYQRYTAYKEQPDAETILTSFLINLIYLPEAVIFTHLIVNYINPKFYFRKRYKLFYLIFAAIVVLYPLVPFLIRTLIVNRYIKINAEPYDLGNYFAAILIFIFGVTILSLNSLTRYLQEEAMLQQKIDNDRLKALIKLKETELKLLRSQLHPHFLFNTLNNLYSLALEKSDKTPDLIIRLGDMLSYVIYDCNSDKVLLSKEIDFLNSYIELQRVRFISCQITNKITGDIHNQKIVPMLLHTFVDNSFKHGAAMISGDSWIKISIDAHNGFLDFRIVNNKRSRQEIKKEAGGIGIENAKKRLELLYKERYELKIDDSESTYSVYLRLHL